jgi:hypothetical protein
MANRGIESWQMLLDIAAMVLLGLPLLIKNGPSGATMVGATAIVKQNGGAMENKQKDYRFHNKNKKNVHLKFIFMNWIIEKGKRF